jgi:ferredoxin-like protein FixX
VAHTLRDGEQTADGDLARIREHAMRVKQEATADELRICVAKSCTYVCPASCYKLEGNSSVTLITDGCLECGSCRIICSEHKNVDWEYPRGGHGILFKFG